MNTHSKFAKQCLYKSPEQKKQERKNFIHPVGLVYMIFNDVDSLIYIGSTSGSMRKRYEHHMDDSFNPENTKALYMHIRELGYRHFSWKIIDSKENVTLAQLRELENAYIVKHNSVLRGLNMQYATKDKQYLYLGEVSRYDERCEHSSFRRVCRSCDEAKPPVSICKHNKIKHMCHKCYRCQFCNVLCTPEHQALPSHAQRAIEAAQAAEHTANVAQIIKQAVHRPELFQLE